MINRESQIDFKKLRELQKRLAKRVKLKDVDLRKIRYIGACDVSYKGGKAKGAIVIYDKVKNKIIYENVMEKEIDFPYVPTFLSFREIPVIEELFKKLEINPHAVFFDGQGILHPFGLGLASHFGVVYNLLTIGVAKKRLVGEVKELPEKELEYKPVYLDGIIKGYCLRLKKGKKFFWISPGNLITPHKALRLTLRFIKGSKHILIDKADKLSKT